MHYIYTHISISIYLSIHLFIFLPVYLSMSLSFYLSSDLYQSSFAHSLARRLPLLARAELWLIPEGALGAPTYQLVLPLSIYNTCIHICI